MLARGDGTYLRSSNRDPTARDRWDWVLLSFKSLLGCVENQGEPAWMSSSPDSTVLFITTEGVLERRWASNDLGTIGMNSTSLTLVEMS